MIVNYSMKRREILLLNSKLVGKGTGIFNILLLNSKLNGKGNGIFNMKERIIDWNDAIGVWNDYNEKRTQKNFKS